MNLLLIKGLQAIYIASRQSLALSTTWTTFGVSNVVSIGLAPGKKEILLDVLVMEWIVVIYGSAI